MSTVAHAYGTGAYGAGPYGGFGRPLPPDPIGLPAPRPDLPTHILGVGPWAAGVAWRALPNYGLVPTGRYPSLPLMSPPGLTRMSFTLNRTGPGEARVETVTSCRRAAVIEEMVTDLWWRRRDGATGDVEDVGRFNAHTVDLSTVEGRLHTSATFRDHRGVLEGRLKFTAGPLAFYPAGTTKVVDILRELIPVNSLIDLRALDTVDLGYISKPFTWEAGAPVTDIIDALQKVSPDFDWAVELDSDYPRPQLRLWPGGRGTDRGVVLLDDGSGYSPITAWQRRTNRSEYANTIYYSGKDVSALIEPDTTDLPTGQRDGVASDPDLLSYAMVAEAARRELDRRSVRRASWELRLAPGFWGGRDHIDLGDPVRVIVRLGDETLDESHRVEAIAVEVHPAGVEEVTLTVGMPRTSTNPASTANPTGVIVKKLLNYGRRQPPPS